MTERLVTVLRRALQDLHDEVGARDHKWEGFYAETWRLMNDAMVVVQGFRNASRTRGGNDQEVMAVAAHTGLEALAQHLDSRPREKPAAYAVAGDLLAEADMGHDAAGQPIRDEEALAMPGAAIEWRNMPAGKADDLVQTFLGQSNWMPNWHHRKMLASILVWLRARPAPVVWQRISEAPPPQNTFVLVVSEVDPREPWVAAVGWAGRRRHSGATAEMHHDNLTIPGPWGFTATHWRPIVPFPRPPQEAHGG